MNALPSPVSLSCAALVLAATATCTAAEWPVPEVTVVRPVVREVTDAEVFTGRTEAAASITIKSRVTGYLYKVLFNDGADVKRGQVLFEIDPRPYQVELDKAEAGLALGEARLRQAEAEHRRATALHAAKAISQEEHDKAAGDRARAEAEVRVARVVCEAARLNLEFTRVVAPLDGRIGRHLLDPGGLVKADETPLATVAARDPMYVCFDIDERTFLRLRRAVREGKIKDLTEPGLAVMMGLADEEGFPHQGRLAFVDAAVDPEKGTLRLRAIFANAERLLVPGLSARVRLPLGRPYRALLVPEDAVGGEAERRFVLVVGEKDVVERRTVVPGPRQDGLWAVKEGLGEDDRVVVGRPKGLRPGMTVRTRTIPVAAPGTAPAVTGGRVEENKPSEADAIAANFSFPGQITLDDKQQEALLALKKEYTPRLEALDARIEKIEKIRTPGRERTVSQQVKGALTLKALHAERRKLLEEIETKKTDLLTDEQKALLPRTTDPKKVP